MTKNSGRSFGRHTLARRISAVCLKTEEMFRDLSRFFSDW